MLASLYSWGDWFESHFVGNTEDRFCRDKANLPLPVVVPLKTDWTDLHPNSFHPLYSSLWINSWLRTRTWTECHMHSIFCLIRCVDVSIFRRFDVLTFRCFVFRCLVWHPSKRNMRGSRWVQFWQRFFIWRGARGFKYNVPLKRGPSTPPHTPPPAKRHLNGASLANRWWPNIEYWLGSLVIFQGIRTSIAAKPLFQGGYGPLPLQTLYFCDFSGGGGGRVPCPPSGVRLTMVG